MRISDLIDRGNTEAQDLKAKPRGNPSASHHPVGGKIDRAGRPSL
jgi:hypothetical protein